MDSFELIVFRNPVASGRQGVHLGVVCCSSTLTLGHVHARSACCGGFRDCLTVRHWAIGKHKHSCLTYTAIQSTLPPERSHSLKSNVIHDFRICSWHYPNSDAPHFQTSRKGFNIPRTPVRACQSTMSPCGAASVMAALCI